MKFDWKYLSVALPDDIRMVSEAGFWDQAIEMIDLRMERRIPEAVRQRLLIEKAIIQVIRHEYTYSWDEACELMRSQLTSFDPSELKFYQNEGTADWHYVNGKVYFQRRFFKTLLKTKPEIYQKWTGRSEDKYDAREQELLMDTIHEMQIQGYATRKIHARCFLKVDDAAFRPDQKVRVHLPVPALAPQVQDIEIIRFSQEPDYLAPADSVCRTAYFEEAPHENHEYSVEFSIVNRAPYVKPDPAQVSAQQPSFHTEEQPPHIFFTPLIRELTAELTGEETNPLKKARAFYDYVTTRVNYTFMREYFTLEHIPEYAAKNLKGDCGVQALLFITLCRCAGIPAKWQSGLDAGPLEIGMHDWAMFYVAPYGWLFADPSYGGSAYRAGNTEKWNHYFGNLDPYRIIFNSEYQHDFTPDKLENRSDPYDNQIGEIEYEGHGLMGDEFDGDHELISIEKL